MAPQPQISRREGTGRSVSADSVARRSRTRLRVRHAPPRPDLHERRGGHALSPLRLGPSRPRGFMKPVLGSWEHPMTRYGYALIELLIASVVVPSAAALLVGGLVASNRCIERRIEVRLATQLLASQLASLDDQLSDALASAGTFAPPLSTFTWTLERSEAPLAPLLEATLTVTVGNRLARVVTYRQHAEH